jgi:hypothetical protein
MKLIINLIGIMTEKKIKRKVKGYNDRNISKGYERQTEA